MLDRLGQLALLSEGQAPVVVGVGIVRLDVQGVPEVLDRPGQLALLSERVAQVVVDAVVVRPDLQGALVMFDRLGQLASLSERNTHVVLSERRLGVRRKGMGPELLRVMPDLGLVPGENSQAYEDADGRAGNDETPGAPPRELRGAHQDRAAYPSQVGIAIRGDLGTIMKDPEHR